MTVIAITGHRPERINSPAWVSHRLGMALQRAHPEKLYIGMAHGADLMAARSAYYERIPYVAVRPWTGHRESLPSGYWQQQWDRAWEHAVEQVTIDDSWVFPGYYAYHQRNKYMVDRADKVIAVWDGSFKGGTFQTIKLAQARKLPVFVIDPNKAETRWLPT